MTFEHVFQIHSLDENALSLNENAFSLNEMGNFTNILLFCKILITSYLTDKYQLYALSALMRPFFDNCIHYIQTAFCLKDCYC